MGLLPRTKDLDDKVLAFRNTFAANPDFVEQGQFQVTEAIRKDIHKRIEDEWMGFPVDALRPDVRDFKDRLGSLSASERAKFRQLLTDLKFDVPETISILSDDASALTRVTLAYNSRWNTGGVPARLSFPAPTTLAAYQEARRYELDACARTARALPKKLTAARGARKAGIRPSGPIAGASLASSSGGGTIVRYNPVELGRTVEQMIAGMKSGYVYVLGVLSGRTTKKGLTPEHWLVAFNYSEGSIFLFWDGDSATTHLMDRDWGKGIGMLFYFDDHLSTAVDDYDLRKLGLFSEKTEASGGSNFHADAPMRHRYQVLQAFPYPFE
jgi:hypothetical protein